VCLLLGVGGKKFVSVNEFVYCGSTNFGVLWVHAVSQCVCKCVCGFNV